MTRYQTAGIVCYTIINDTLHFLLGREQFVHGWSCSHQWSEPGGHAKKTDLKSTLNTAIREFNEETLGVLPNMSNLMQEHMYTACLNLCIKRKRGKTYYLMHLPLCHNVRTEFHIRREQLKGIQYTIHRLQNIQRELRASNVPSPESPRRIEDRFQIIQDIVGFQEMSDQTCRVKVQSICPIDKVYFRFIKETDEYQTTYTYIDVPQALAAVYIRLLSLKQLLIKEIEALPLYLQQSAIIMPKGCTWLPRVRREFLEKDRLEWISTNEVVDRIGCSWFRPGFEIAVQLMITYLARSVKNDAQLKETNYNEDCSCSVPKSPNPVIHPCSILNETF